jgi:hypothetical protein
MVTSVHRSPNHERSKPKIGPENSLGLHLPTSRPMTARTLAQKCVFPVLAIVG